MKRILSENSSVCQLPRTAHLTFQSSILIASHDKVKTRNFVDKLQQKKINFSFRFFIVIFSSTISIAIMKLTYHIRHKKREKAITRKIEKFIAKWTSICADEMSHRCNNLWSVHCTCLMRLRNSETDIEETEETQQQQRRRRSYNEKTKQNRVNTCINRAIEAGVENIKVNFDKCPHIKWSNTVQVNLDRWSSRKCKHCRLRIGMHRKWLKRWVDLMRLTIFVVHSIVRSFILLCDGSFTSSLFSQPLPKQRHLLCSLSRSLSSSFFANAVVYCLVYS